METNTQLKEMPYFIDKSKLEKLYKGLPVSIFRADINEIIYENRSKKEKYKGQSKHKIIRTKTIFKEELAEFIKIYGSPQGYYIPENYFNK